MCGPCIIKDANRDVYLGGMSADIFVKKVDCAEKRRKAKHAGRFSIQEFAKIFGFKAGEIDQYIEIDRNVPITYSFSNHKIGNNEVTYYNLQYGCSPLKES